jgi:hypothetical protein
MNAIFDNVFVRHVLEFGGMSVIKKGYKKPVKYAADLGLIRKVGQVIEWPRIPPDQFVKDLWRKSPRYGQEKILPPKALRKAI